MGCVLDPQTITHISFLESEDTIVHSIMVNSIVVTSNDLHEQDAERHHAEEAEALIWEREHHHMRHDDFTPNRTKHPNHTEHAEPEHIGLSGAEAFATSPWVATFIAY